MRQRQVAVRGEERQDRGRGRDSRPAGAPASVPGAPMTALAMQRSAGNAAVVQMIRSGAVPRPVVQRMPQDGSGAGDSSAGRAPSEIMKEIRSQIKKVPEGADEPLMKDYGGLRQGRAHGEMDMRFPRSKEGQEAQQTLTETSALLFDSMKGAQERAKVQDPEAEDEGDDREVQGMLINDRLVFASNFDASVDTLVQVGSEEAGQAPTLEQLLAIEQSEEGRYKGLREHEQRNLREKLASYRRKNKAIVGGLRGTPGGEQGRGDDPAAQALHAKLGQPVIVLDLHSENLREMLTDTDHEGRVFLLRFGAGPGGAKQGRPDKSVHAEQKLLLALSAAGIRPQHDVRGSLAISGKYRPCMGCAAALMYYKERLGFGQLSFNPNYGHYFQSSVNTLYEHHRHMIDEHYLGFIRHMVEEEVTSTPAGWNEAAPEGAEERRGGPTLRVPGKYASRQADNTPPNSDAEDGPEDMPYRRIPERRLEQTWEEETAHIGIGTGAAQTTWRRTGETLSPEQAQELHDLWNFGSDGRTPTEADWHRALDLAGRYHTQQGMTYEYLGGVVGRNPEKFGSMIAKHLKEGPQRHVPTRSSKIESRPRKRVKTGAADKQFTKGGKIDDDGKAELTAVIERLLPHSSWCQDWKQRHEAGTGPDLKPTGMPDELLLKLAELRETPGYDVPSMSQFLYTGENGDNLRKAINRKGKKLLDARRTTTDVTAPVDYDGDTEMDGV
ncbi:hypothetical protein Srubr_27720 [Streptomyces rubradiris]|uniref:Uncharacterized protein n=2 Tax=Streptomyces rubradiris TaxID=285531 RepID=A0ABQ3RAQ1_STRRR|nr:hypothetical protein GCM10018792_50600 [Streptomyces rubradiris]GHI52926.1 hypothetical protein Srubr_27720 [Streptomyces rubradiris]